MSTQQKREKRGLAADGISEEAVAHYLQTHPDFFERHGGLLGSLRLPHATGPAISLIERQVAILRGRNAKLDRKLHELIAVARSNDDLSRRIHDMAKSLIATTDVTAVLDVLQHALHDGFGADTSLLVLFGGEGFDLPDTPFVRIIRREDPALEVFATFLQAESPRCGRISEGQGAFLFGAEAAGVASAALVPLVGAERIGFLAVGSADPDRYLPTMSTDFLSRIGDLVSHALAAHGR